MEWMIMPFKKYAQFSGRSRRMEFWMWVLFVIIAAIVLSVIDSLLGLGGRTQVGTGVPGSATGFGAYANTQGGILTGVFSLAILVPNVALQVRRLHDIGRSGWWVGAFYLLYIVFLVLMLAIGVSALGGFAPGGATLNYLAYGVMVGFGALAIFVYAIVLLVFFFLPGTVGPNRYGPDPKNPEANLSDVFS